MLFLLRWLSSWFRIYAMQFANEYSHFLEPAASVSALLASSFSVGTPYADALVRGAVGQGD
ncbi:hypothetical protein ACFSQE_10250 [Vogesella fluminis]|uniref:hypothetical protein n=1 Tax=Vogesella fluminis TaxID=1069161 RepID=UPI00363031CC